MIFHCLIQFSLHWLYLRGSQAKEQDQLLLHILAPIYMPLAGGKHTDHVQETPPLWSPAKWQGCHNQCRREQTASQGWHSSEPINWKVDVCIGVPAHYIPITEIYNTIISQWQYPATIGHSVVQLLFYCTTVPVMKTKTTDVRWWSDFFVDGIDYDDDDDDDWTTCTTTTKSATHQQSKQPNMTHIFESTPTFNGSKSGSHSNKNATSYGTDIQRRQHPKSIESRARNVV